MRCAAIRVKSLGYFAGPILSQDQRWPSGSIYVFTYLLTQSKNGISAMDGLEAATGGSNNTAWMVKPKLMQVYRATLFRQ